MRASNTELLLHPEEYSPAPASAFSVKDILRTVRRAWHFPVIGFLIGLILAVSYVMFVPKLYKSTTRILVDRSMNRYLQTNKIADEPTFDQTELESQIHILPSNTQSLHERFNGSSLKKEFRVDLKAHIASQTHSQLDDAWKPTNGPENSCR